MLRAEQLAPELDREGVDSLCGHEPSHGLQHERFVVGLWSPPHHDAVGTRCAHVNVAKRQQPWVDLERQVLDAQLQRVAWIGAVAKALRGAGLGFLVTLAGLVLGTLSLILALPLMAVIALLSLPESWAGIAGGAWIGLAYVSVFSMLVGFVFWYRGLAIGGIAAVGQLQLLQPFFGLLLAAGLLHERVSPLMVVTTLAIVACVAGARKFAR